MGLIDLKTNLKSLKYGNDQKGGGSSNQPYIVTPIPDDLTSSSPDFLLRNGYLNPLNSIQDVSRLTRMFLDTKSPNGLLFITKQELLERQNPIQINTDRVYSPLNTLAQAGVVSTGYHLNKQGLNPFTPGYYNGGRSGYFFSTLAGSNVDDGINGGENRLALLYTSKIARTFAINPFGITSPSDSTNLISYSGGPNSVLGFGKTNIRIQNPTRTVIPKSKAIIGHSYGYTDITNENYLTPIGQPTVNWSYKPTSDPFSDFFGASGEFYLNRKLSSDNSYNDTSSLYTNNVLNLLNRDTSTVIPIGKSANTFVKSQDPLKSKPGYLRIGPINPGSINWVYNPSYNRNPNGLPSVSVKYIADLDLDEAKVYETFYTSTPSNLLNRDTSTVIPIGKSDNTFNKNTGELKTDPNYLVTKGVEGNINYQTFLTGLSNEFEIASGIRNLDYENNAETIVGNLFNSSSLSRPSYYKDNKSFGNVITPNLKLFQTASIKYGTRSSQTTLINNFKQNVPEIVKVSNDIVEGKKKTTALSSLNPTYFKLNENNTITSVPADEFIKDFNREKTYKTSRTVYSSSIFVRGNVNTTDTTYSDGQNVTNIIRGSRGNQTEQANSDLIKFFFEINNNDALTDTQNWFLFFRAYLNDFGDSYKADWQSYKYIGRAENFYKYGGFSRDISLGFTVYAHTRAEMVPIYNKLNYLVGTTAPDYSKAGYMRGNFVNLTVGDYLDNVPGIITDISLKPSFDAGWDIDRDVLTGTILQQFYLQLPKLIEVSMTFTPIHSFTPQFGEAFIRNTIPLPEFTTNTQQPTQDEESGDIITPPNE